MNKKLKRGMMALLGVFFLLGNIAATQYFAYKLGYQGLLGSSLFTLYNKPVYFPFDFWIWFFKYYADAPKVFASGFSILGITFGIGLIVVNLIKRNHWKKQLTSCGTAHWASREEIKEAKLMDGKGIFLGKTEDGFYLRDNDDRHAMVISPTRGGKGTGLVTPTALSWPESAVFIDIKGEIYGLSAGYRKNVLGQTVIRFDPSNAEGSACFNPLDEVRLYTENEVKDTINIVHAVVRPDGSDKPDHWRDLAGSLIEGVALHLKYTQNGSASFSDVLNFIFGEIPIRERLQEMAETVHATTEEQKSFLQVKYGVHDGVHPFVKQKAYTFLQKEEKEFAGIMSTVEEVLKDYFDPILARNTDQSSFHINDLMNADKAISLYLIVPPSDLERLAKFFRLIVVLIYQRLTEKMEFENGRPVTNYKHKLLLLLDEFPALGRISEFEKALGYIAGYGLRAFIIVQGLNQLFKPEMYGRNTSIIDNCHIRVFHTPNDRETPEYMSNTMGKETIQVKNKSYQNDLMQFLGENSYNVQEKGRELMTAAEVSSMDSEDEIIFVAGKAPIRCKKIRYYKDKNFQQRLKPEPPTDSLYPIDELIEQKKEICNVINEKDGEKIRQAREMKDLERKMEEMQRIEFLKKGKDKVEAFEAKKKEENNAMLDHVERSLEIGLAGAALKVAGDTASENEDDEKPENEDDENVSSDEDTSQDESGQPDGFNDPTQNDAFFEGQDSFDDGIDF